MKDMQHMEITKNYTGYQDFQRTDIKHKMFPGERKEIISRRKTGRKAK